MAALLRSKTPADWYTARDTLRAQRAATIESLLQVIKEDLPEQDLLQRWRSPQRVAFELLGELRPDDPHVIRALFDQLKFQVQPWYEGVDSSANLGLKYPAVGALVRIGQPALKEAWHRLEMSDDPLEGELAAWIIGHVEGGSTALLLLDRRMASADPAKRKRFAAVRTRFENTP